MLTLTTEAELTALHSGLVKESLHLEYKASDAIDKKSDPKKLEMQITVTVHSITGRCMNASPFPNYPLSVSRNRTGSPDDGVVNSPCHITRRPRTKVPTGQPVTRTPS
jgi:hypothetical protein